uniref:Uncharacterized protein n=1 Tax=viral metagenome TaxID=1070528 RepID=A0A6M3INK3_9ZZZZ
MRRLGYILAVVVGAIFVVLTLLVALAAGSGPVAQQKVAQVLVVRSWASGVAVDHMMPYRPLPDSLEMWVVGTVEAHALYRKAE